MNLFKWICVFIMLSGTAQALASEPLIIPCEILEASETFRSQSPEINGIRYLLIHQANSADRDQFSDWLKTHSDSDVTFVFKGLKYHGILCRLAHCFGRGLLLFTGQVTLQKRDIIHVNMSN